MDKKNPRKKGLKGKSRLLFFSSFFFRNIFSGSSFFPGTSRGISYSTLFRKKFRSWDFSLLRRVTGFLFLYLPVGGGRLGRAELKIRALLGIFVFRHMRYYSGFFFRISYSGVGDAGIPVLLGPYSSFSLFTTFPFFFLSSPQGSSSVPFFFLFLALVFFIKSFVLSSSSFFFFFFFRLIPSLWEGRGFSSWGIFSGLGSSAEFRA